MIHDHEYIYMRNAQWSYKLQTYKADDESTIVAFSRTLHLTCSRQTEESEQELQDQPNPDYQPHFYFNICTVYNVHTYTRTDLYQRKK